MTHLLLLFLICLVLAAGHAFTGCQKKSEEVKCYECEMTYATGVTAGTQFPCSTNIAAWQNEQKDNNGQAITSVCREK